MFRSLQNMFKIPELRKRIFITFGLLITYRLGMFITLPGVDPGAVAEAANQGGMDLLNFAGAITGGNLRNGTIFALGIMPYISASIIFSLLVKVIPQLEALQKEGEAGRKKIGQYTRYVTVLLCLIQSWAVISYIKSAPDLAYDTGWFAHVIWILGITTGTILLMWIGEQITDFGLGNGISLIIMAGIIARMPSSFGIIFDSISTDYALDPNTLPISVLSFCALLALFVAVVAGVVFMTHAHRRITIQSNRQTRGRRVYGGQRHYVPLKLNAAGVMPIIFAQTLLYFPAAILGYVADLLGWSWLIRLSEMLSFNTGGFLYIVAYGGLTAFFAFFWTSLMFNPVEIATNWKEQGSFIPGIRPGKKTSTYLEQVMNRITFVGAIFLAFIAIVPTEMAAWMGYDFTVASFLGGTAILIVVGVALDLVQKVESHLLVRHYEGFMKAGRIRGRR